MGPKYGRLTWNYVCLTISKRCELLGARFPVSLAKSCKTVVI